MRKNQFDGIWRKSEEDEMVYRRPSRGAAKFRQLPGEIRGQSRGIGNKKMYQLTLESYRIGQMGKPFERMQF